MKILVCQDSWKGSLTAREACHAVARGLARELPDARIVCVPMADGGEGTLDAVAACDPGDRISREVCGPLPGRRVGAEYLLWPARREALVEMAACAGLTLLRTEERNPLRTTTVGVGELIRDALDRGARRLGLAVGGSATVDGGAGMAAALGWRFLDAAGQALSLGGGELLRLAHIVPPANPLPADLCVEVWCDVTNPLVGPRGAAAVFGPQKGADAAAVERLEAGLQRLADVAQRDLGKSIAAQPGTGAAGGLAAGAIAFLDARLVSGVEALAARIRLEDALADADWVVTGEGRFDSQSLDGKVVSGVVALARRRGVRVAVLAGSIALAPQRWHAQGIAAVAAARPGHLSLDESMQRAAELAEAAARRLASELRNAG